MQQQAFENMQLHPTNHGKKRMKNRSLSRLEAKVIYWFGSELTDDEIFFSKKDAKKLISDISHSNEYKFLIKPLGAEKNDDANKDSKISKNVKISINSLVGWKIVVRGTNLISCYRCTKESQRKRISRLLKSIKQ